MADDLLNIRDRFNGANYKVAVDGGWSYGGERLIVEVSDADGNASACLSRDQVEALRDALNKALITTEVR